MLRVQSRTFAVTLRSCGSNALLCPVSCGLGTTRRPQSSSTNTALELQQLATQVKALTERCAQLEQMQHTDQMIRYYASLPRTKLDINLIVAKCQDPKYSQDVFCHRELTVLLAHMITMIDGFPNGLFAMPNVVKVRRILSPLFSELSAHPVPEKGKSTLDASFLALVDSAMMKLEPVVQTMALGVLELRKQLSMHRRSQKAPSEAGPLDVPLLQDSLDEFYLALVQFKFLALQLLQTSKSQPAAGVVGLVDTSIDLVQVAESAARNASMVCTEHHGDCPEVEIEVMDSDGGRAFISHLNDHLNYILVELLKNALRATVDAHMKRNVLGFVDCEDMPPVKVKIATNRSKDTATVVIADQGGGIRREDMPKIMSYTFTSAKQSALADGEVNQEPTLLAGYGYGLPMSRIHARLFGGDIVVQSVEGYGTDAYLFLAKKGCPLRQHDEPH